MSCSPLSSIAVPTNIYSVRKQLRPQFIKEPVTWLISGPFDLIFVCGFAPWILGYIAYVIAGQLEHPTASQPHHLLTVFFVVASLIIGESHQFTSIIRYYGSFRSRTKAYKMQRIPFWVMYGCAILFGLGLWANTLAPSAPLLQPIFVFLTSLFQGAVLIFPVVLMQHVCAQALAIGLVYCRMEGYNQSPNEKWSMSVIVWLLVAAGACTIASPFVLPEPPPVLSFTCFVGAGSAVVLFAIHVLRRGITRGEWLPAGAAIMWANLSLFIVLPLLVPAMVYVWLFVPLFFHASQHWTLAWITHKREAKQRKAASNSGLLNSTSWRLVLPVQIVTLVVLFLPLLLTNVHGAGFLGDNTLSVFWSMLVFYIHYFADRVVWRPQT